MWFDLPIVLSATEIEDTVGVDVESNLDLRETMRCKRDVREFDFTEQVVVLRACTLTLVHLDKHSRLVIGVLRRSQTSWWAQWCSA